jgi:hypothetical protein
MAERKDILLDDDYDLQAKDGDFVVANSDNQNVELLLLANPGDFKQSPLVGFGILQMQNGKLTAEAKRKMNLALSQDGYKARSIDLTNGKLTIDV